MLYRALVFVVLATLVAVSGSRAMEQNQVPTQFSIPWGNSAGTPYINNIPTASQIGISNCAASLTDGFPPLTFVPAIQGGCPPFGKDFNGILRQLSQWARWQGAGAATLYDASFSSSIGGYPTGATLAQASPAGCFWVSTINNNTSNPDAGGANWTSSCPGGGVGTASVSTGTANAQVVTVTPYEIRVGAKVSFIAGLTNTSSATLNINGAGVTAVRKLTPNGLTALSGGEIQASTPGSFIYDGTFWVIASQVFPAGTWAGAAGGTVNAITLAVTGADSQALLTGVPISFIASGTNTPGGVTVNVNGFGATTLNKLTAGGTSSMAGCEIGSGQIVTVMFNGSVYNLLTASQTPVPTRQVLTSGSSATYTTPTCARQIRIQAIGGGGGGASTAGAGGLGGTTSFNSITAVGGSGAAASNANGGAGGIGGTGGVGSANTRLRGSDGSAIGPVSNYAGGTGAPGFKGTGAGRGGITTGSPTAGGTNTGAGGGGGTNNLAGTGGGGGGGGGEQIEFVINAPAATYTYTIGAGGTAAAGGGTGGSGLIVVDETY